MLQEFNKLEKFEIDCTHSNFGNEEILQPKFSCLKCDKDSICIKCIKSCHKDCKDDNDKLDEVFLSRVASSFFVCQCAKELMHKVVKTESSEKSITKCSLKTFDKKMNLKTLYKCEDHHVTICSICFLHCHFRCKHKSKFNVETLDMNKTNCECTNENHSYNNKFTLNFDFNVLVKETGINFKQSVQFYNSIFQSGALNELSEYVIYCLKEKITSDFFKQTIHQFYECKICLSPAYYVPEIIKIFEYENLLNFIRNFTPKTHEDVFLVTKLTSILFYVHVKRDFQYIKKLSTSDFMTSSILERLSFRHFMMSKNVFTKNIHEKYLEGDFSLIKLILLIGQLFSANDKALQSSYSLNFLIPLNFICFVLKKMLLSLEDIKELIIKLFDFITKYLKTNFKYTDIPIEEQTEALILIMQKKVKDLNKIVNKLSELFYIIGIIYNDLTFEKNYNKLSKNEDHKFLNTNTLYTEKLCKMIIHLGLFSYKINKDFLFTALDSDSTFNYSLYNESLKLFCVSENIYLKHLTNLKNQKIEIIENNEKIKLFDLKINNGQEESFKVIFEIKIKIENLFYEFFTNVNITEPSTQLFAIIDELTNILADLNISSKSNLSNIFSQDERQNKYAKKILIKLNDNFNFMSNIKNADQVDSIVNSLIQISIDDSLTKFLTIYSKIDNIFLQPNELKRIFQFLSIFLLNKRGIKYFCLGHNLTRIFKLMPFFPIEVLEFIYLIFKGVNEFGIDIENHKILQIIKFKIISFWNFHSDDYVENIDTKKKILITFKIINKISDLFGYEDYGEIKNAAVYLIIKKQVLKYVNKKSMFTIFEEEVDRGTSFHYKPNLDNSYDGNETNLNKMNSNNCKLLPSQKEKDSFIKNEEIELITISDRFDKENKQTHSNKFILEDLIFTSNDMHIYEDKISNKFYFAFYELICKNNLFVLEKSPSNEYLNPEVETPVFGNKDIYEKLMEFLHYQLKQIISDGLNLLTLNKRKIFLRLIRSFNFIDIYKSTDINSKILHLSNMEFQTLNLCLDEDFLNFTNTKKKMTLGQASRNIYSTQSYAQNSVGPNYYADPRIQSYANPLIQYVDPISGLTISKQRIADPISTQGIADPRSTQSHADLHVNNDKGLIQNCNTIYHKIDKNNVNNSFNNILNNELEKSEIHNNVEQTSNISLINLDKIHENNLNQSYTNISNNDQDKSQIHNNVPTGKAILNNLDNNSFHTHLPQNNQFIETNLNNSMTNFHSVYIAERKKSFEVNNQIPIQSMSTVPIPSTVNQEIPYQAPTNSYQLRDYVYSHRQQKAFNQNNYAYPVVDDFSILLPSYNKILKLFEVIEIFIIELKSIPELYKKYQNNISEYAKELIVSVKYISDFIYIQKKYLE